MTGEEKIRTLCKRRNRCGNRQVPPPRAVQELIPRVGTTQFLEPAGKAFYVLSLPTGLKDLFPQTEVRGFHQRDFIPQSMRHPAS
jgi:hypothetical protein